MTRSARSVIVVSHRPGTWLTPCLRSVRDQADQLVMVDNGSAGEVASDAGRAVGAEVVRSSVNLGFTGGVNAGLDRARGDVVAFLNDDAVADPHWLDSAERALGDPAVAAVGPKVVLAGSFLEVRLEDDPWYGPGDARPLGRQLRSVTVDGIEVFDQVVGPGVHEVEQATEQGSGGAQAENRWRWTKPPHAFYVPLGESGRLEGTEVHIDGQPVPGGVTCRLVNSAGLFLRADGYAGDRGLHTPDDGRWDCPHEPFGVSGTALVTRSDTLSKVGRLAGPFFAYYEDVDWCFRARAAGLRVLYDPGATVTHHRSMTASGTLGGRIRTLAERNRILCLARNAPPAVALHELRRLVASDPSRRLRLGALAMTPWAVSTRVVLSRRAVLSPSEVWRGWAGVDVP